MPIGKKLGKKNSKLNLGKEAKKEEKGGSTLNISMFKNRLITNVNEVSNSEREKK